MVVQPQLNIPTLHVAPRSRTMYLGRFFQNIFRLQSNLVILGLSMCVRYSLQPGIFWIKKGTIFVRYIRELGLIVNLF